VKQAPTKKPKAIIIDVDKTLTERTTWYELTERLGGSSREHASIFVNYLQGHISFDQAKKELFALWNSNGPVHKDQLIDIFKTVPLRGEAFSVFNELQDRGYELCLISGSIKMFIEIVAERFNIKHYYGNSELLFDEKGYWIDFLYNKDEANHKVSQLNHFLDTTSFTVEDCIAIGDSANDIELFQVLPGVALNTQSAHLRELAWQEITYLPKLIQVLESLS
jgi:HAD superfamily phosphoserine phosphatase-like hydrolase